MPSRLNKRWEIAQPVPTAVDQELSEYPPFFRQLLFNRGIVNAMQAAEYLSANTACDDPLTMLGMRETVDRLEWAIKKQEQVVVYGDYDVDGVTATALLVQVLQRLGAQVRPYIPNRFDEGYGLNVEAIEKLHAQGAQLVVTVDCGIRSLAEVKRAEELGMDLIVSDHHHPLEEIPDAFAVICPKQPGCEYRDKNLSGVGISYKIAQALAVRFSDSGIEVKDWLDLVALGTVADLVPLIGENRSLVRQGLDVLRRNPRPGILSLANVARVNFFQITAGEIGFMLGPRLNAAGRMETARDALNLLMARSMSEAAPMAQRLDDQNRHRQEMTRKMQEEASGLAKTIGSDLILFAFSEEFSEGLVGLAASRLAEQHYRPAIVGRKGEEFTRASCRSIREFHITQALDECKDLLERHGGHSMAAGFTLRTENLPAFTARMQAIAERELASRELRPLLHADKEFRLADLKPVYVKNFLRYLDQLQPTGQDNPEAMFVSRDVQVKGRWTVGGDKQHLKLKVGDGGVVFDAIAFRMGHLRDDLPERVDILYAFGLDKYNGQENVQLTVRDIRPAGSSDD